MLSMETLKEPKVSICLPVFNGEQFLAEAMKIDPQLRCDDNALSFIAEVRDFEIFKYIFRPAKLTSRAVFRYGVTQTD